MASPQGIHAPIESSLKRGAAALREARVPFLLGGSMASWARGGPETKHDLDFIVRPKDAESALQALADAGMQPERPPEEWLYKAWDGDVLVDLIFVLTGLEDLDEVFERGEDFDVLGVRMRVITIEDMLTAKLLSMSEHELDYSGPVTVARALRELIDWPTLRARTESSPYARAFLVLLEELGVISPGHSARAGGAEVRVIAPGERG